MIVSGLSSLRVIAYQGRCQMCLQRQPFDLRVHSVCLIVQALSYMAKLTLPRSTHSDSLQRYDCVSVSQKNLLLCRSSPKVRVHPVWLASGQGVSCNSGLFHSWESVNLFWDFFHSVNSNLRLICSTTTANVNFLQFPPELNLFAVRSGWQLVHNWLATAPGVFCTTRCLSCS